MGHNPKVGAPKKNFRRFAPDFWAPTFEIAPAPMIASDAVEPLAAKMPSELSS